MTSHSLFCYLRAALICLPVAFFCHSATAQGLLLVKQYGWSADSTASPVEYESIQRFSTVYNITTSQGATKRIMATLVVEDLPFSPFVLPQEIVSETDAEILSDKISKLENTIAKHGSTKAYLDPYLKRLKSAQKKWNEGSIFYESQWISKSEHQERMQAAAHAIKANEQKFLDEQNRKQQARIAAEKEAKAAEEQKRLEQLALEKARIDSEERVRLAELEAQKAADQRATAEREEQKRRLAEKDKALAEKEAARKAENQALLEKHTRYLAKYLNDNFVEPANLNKETTPSYAETISFINGKAGKCQNWLGFGKSSQRFVLVTPEVVVVFNAADFPPEAQVSTTPSNDGLRSFVTLEVRNSEKLVEFIKLIPLSKDEIATSQFAHQLAVEVDNRTDAEKVMKAFNHLIGMFGGKKELF